MFPLCGNASRLRGALQTLILLTISSASHNAAPDRSAPERSSKPRTLKAATSCSSLHPKLDNHWRGESSFVRGAVRGSEEQDVEADHDIATAKVLRLVGGGGPALVGKPVENHAPFLLCTDLDDTLVGDAQSLAEFNRLWKEKLAPRGCKLVFNTGRSFIDYLALRRDWDLLLPDAFIGACGTKVYTFDAQGQEHPVRAWADDLRSSSSWDKRQVASQILCNARLKALYSPGQELREKSESEGNELLFSLRLPATTTDVEHVRRDVLAALDGCSGEDIRINIASVSFTGATTVTGSGNSSGGESSTAGCLFVDVMPLAAGKGRALAYVRHALFAMSAAQCVVAGDSGNDVPMFESDVQRGIMVGNAKSELLAVRAPSHFVASAKYAAGLLQGLFHYGLLVPTAIDSAPEWIEKPLPRSDDRVQCYCWNHGARELIAERTRVAEILALHAKAKRGPWHREDLKRQGIGYLGIPMSFQEAFIDSDAKRITLVDRVHTYFNSRWKRDVISFQQESSYHHTRFPDASDRDSDARIEAWRREILMRYEEVEGHFTMLLENLVLMQALYEELKPETRDLINRCTSHEQLDKSMLFRLTMKTSPAQESSNALLLPSIGKREEGLVELVEPQTDIASEKKEFPLKALEGIIDEFRKKSGSSNFIASGLPLEERKKFHLARLYDQEKVAFLEPIFYMLKNIQERLEVLEKK